jgi:acetyl-CoA C-acetyltransferase/acetyl-CoA acyltransferase
MRKVAVVGVGETKFSGPQPKTQVEMFAEAATEAITESNLKPKDIKALFVAGRFRRRTGDAAGLRR